MSAALYRTAAFVVLVGVVGFASRSPVSAASASCSVVGTWDLTGLTVDGKAVPLTVQQRKVVTAKHFLWIAQALRRDTLPLKTHADSLLYFSVSGGSGSYTLQGNSYVEHIDMFVDPAWLGKDWKATCRTEKDRWLHSYTTAASGDTPSSSVIEDWRRRE